MLETRKFLGMLYQQKHWQLELKGAEREPNETRAAEPQNSTDRKQAYKTTHLQKCAPLHAKGRMTPVQKPNLPPATDN